MSISEFIHILKVKLRYEFLCFEINVAFVLAPLLVYVIGLESFWIYTQLLDDLNDSIYSELEELIQKHLNE